MPALLTIIGELERLSAELYPYRYIITPLLIAAVVGLIIVGVRRDVHIYLLRHRLATGLIATPALIVVLFVGYYTISPFFQRSFLEEESPLAAQAASPAVVVASEATPVAAAETSAEVDDGQGDGPIEGGITHRGEFEGADDFHFGRGDALIITTEDGKKVLRFENFSVLNGPDLFVYLSEDPSGKSVIEELNLGELKATDGAFNYDIPDDVDLSVIKSAVVWCRAFGVLFAVAEFSAN